MNMLFLISTLGLGGAEKQLIAWTEILQADLGAQVCVASFDAGRTQWVQTLKEMDVPVAVLGRDQSLARRTGSVVALARRNRIDIAHAFSCYLSPLAIAASTATGAVPASSVRGDGVADLRALRTIYRRPVLSMVKYFTANSHEAIAQVKPRLAAKAVVQYVPNLVIVPALEARGERTGRARIAKTALMVGRMDRNKRIDLFLQALATARKLEPGLRGVIVGEGPLLEELRGTAAALGLLPGAVEFLGRLPDVSEHYANADIFVHLAVSEGTPNVVLEAMAAGLPVIATGAGDLRRIIRPRQTGMLVPFDDAEALTRSLVELARTPELGARLGQEARAEMLRSFSRQEVRAALERFYSAIPVRRRRRLGAA